MLLPPKMGQKQKQKTKYNPSLLCMHACIGPSLRDLLGRPLNAVVRRQPLKILHSNRRPAVVPVERSHMTQPHQARCPTAAESRSTSPNPPTLGSADAGDPIRSPPRVPITLLQPSQRKHPSRPSKLFRTVRSAFRSFPILTPVTCRLPHVALHRSSGGPRDGHIHGAIRTTGTLFGHFKARITLAIQDNPRSVPLLLLELAVPTAKFLQDMRASDHLRVALECEKKAANKTPLLEEPMWTAFINSKNTGYAARREPNNSDLNVMQLLHAVSMGAGVLPSDMTDPVDGELTYMRAYFDRVVGSKDSETFYMLNPDEKTSTELSIFFVRI